MFYFAGDFHWTFDENAVPRSLTNIKGYTINVPSKWTVPSGSGYLPSLYVLELEGREVIEKRFETGTSTGQKWSIESYYGGSWLISLENRADHLTGQPNKPLMIKAHYGKF